MLELVRSKVLVLVRSKVLELVHSKVLELVHSKVLELVHSMPVQEHSSSCEPSDEPTGRHRIPSCHHSDFLASPSHRHGSLASTKDHGNGDH
ncbi:MAG: hypothetical protein R3C28_31560 [Pirellulaceae bacterium]